ncbi:MAG TPA: hypothetical protein VGS99_05835, partial [Gammaproteobacteria bacterium]|nr:hypothetical protein [Gammaproteobacteria bacterium]
MGPSLPRMVYFSQTTAAQGKAARFETRVVAIDLRAAHLATKQGRWTMNTASLKTYFAGFG